MFSFIGIGIVLLLGFIWIYVGVRVSKRVNQTEDYLVGGRNVGVALGSATILATWVTGNTILASPQSGFTYGILGPLGYGVGGGIGVVAFGFLALRLRRILPYGRTVGDFFRLRYDKKNYWLFFVCLIVWDLGWLLTQGMAAGIILESIFGVPYKIGVILTIGIVTTYVVIGGMVSVLSTDFMQTLLIMVMVCVFPPLIYLLAGPQHIYNGILNFSPKSMNILDPSSVLFFFAIGVTYIGEIFMDNTFWQRAFALRPDILKRTFAFAGVGWIFVPIAMGTLAFVAIGDNLKLSSGPSSVAPDVVAHYAGHVGSALFLAVLWAALASTMAALFNGVAALVMNDIYNNLINKNATDRRVLFIGRLSTVVLAVITVATTLSRPSTLLSLLIWLGVVNAAYIIPIVLGAYFQKVSRTGTFISIIVAIFCGYLVYGGGALDLLFFKIPMFNFPDWLSGSIKAVVLSFIISMVGTILSSLTVKSKYDFNNMINWKPYSIRSTPVEGEAE
jgi:Na+/proline symporter